MIKKCPWAKHLTHNSIRESRPKNRFFGSDFMLLLASDLTAWQNTMRRTQWLCKIHNECCVHPQCTVCGSLKEVTHRWVTSRRPLKAYLVIASILLPSINLENMHDWSDYRKKVSPFGHVEENNVHRLTNIPDAEAQRMHHLEWQRVN